MERRNFAQILKEAKVDIRREYDRLFSLFYLQKYTDANGKEYNLRDYCACFFGNCPFRGTCLTLDDFDEFYKFHFEQSPKKVTINNLLLFCEYTYNLASCAVSYQYGMMTPHFPSQQYVIQVNAVMEEIGYMQSRINNSFVFVPKSAEAIAVAEIVDPNLSYKVIEYNHHSLRGNLDQKRNILLLLADKLEPQRGKLKEINRQLESDLFTLFNSINLRHNNIAPESKDYREYIAEMKKPELEKWYDDTYQMCLLAFLELDHQDRKKRVAELKTHLQ